MIEIDQAITHILSKCQPIGTESRSTIDSVGHVLAESVTADVDSPPHDKSLVDGFAIRAEDAGKSLRLLEQIVAGEVPTQRVEVGTTSQVMTGAPIPDGAEAMVMVEDVQQVGDQVNVPGNVTAGQFIMPRAKTFARGEVVLASGTRIRPIEVGLLCEVGRAEVACLRRPCVAILPTGDELVPSDAIPGPAQIRNSNGPMLEARTAAAGCEVISLGVGRDHEAELREKIRLGLQADILVLSGGVSAGVRDLVPPTLAELGVQEVFHRVRLKPGKPIWFGAREENDRTTLVFGLPGNPISSLVCFELFVQLAIRVISGETGSIELQPVRLAEPFHHRGNRPTYHPGKMFRDEGRMFGRPLAWQGSADMLTVSRANCLICFTEARDYSLGEKLMALPLS